MSYYSDVITLNGDETIPLMPLRSMRVFDQIFLLID